MTSEYKTLMIRIPAGDEQKGAEFIANEAWGPEPVIANLAVTEDDALTVFAHDQLPWTYNEKICWLLRQTVMTMSEAEYPPVVTDPLMRLIEAVQGAAPKETEE